MRKWNSVISLLIIILFVIHGVAGGFQLSGIIPGGSAVLQVLAWVMIGLIIVHAAIGVKLTVDVCRVRRKTGVSYRKENRLFWTRRISGFTMIVLILCHILIFFVNNGSGAYRLHLFQGPQLVLSILLILTMVLHVVVNIRPLFISMGWEKVRFAVRDIMWILSIVLLFCAVAFVIYYLRWNVFWR